MNDSAIAATPAATPLATLLASAIKPARLAEYRSVLTPQELDAPSAAIAALTTDAAAHDLGWLRRYAVRGEDRFRWLSGMVTNTVNDLSEHGGAWNLVLNAQGRIQGDLTVWREEDALTLEIEAGQVEPLLAHLEHFIIMDDVEIMPVGADSAAPETAVGLSGPKASEVLERMGLPALTDPMTAAHAEWNGLNLRIERGFGVVGEHYALWTPVVGLKRLWHTLTTAGAGSTGCTMLEAFRVAEGIPAYGTDIVERDLPQETAQMRALHFNKGCYLGQEIVERIHSRGNVRRHLRQLQLDGPLPPAGTMLKLNEEEAGRITSAAELPLVSGTRTFALGMIHGEAEAQKAELIYSTAKGNGTARILPTAPSF